MYIKLNEASEVVGFSPENFEGAIYVASNPELSFTKLMNGVYYYSNGELTYTPKEVPYYDKRKAEYPPIGDQLDALWKLIVANRDKIDLGEAELLLSAVQTVKAKYQKPS